MGIDQELYEVLKIQQESKMDVNLNKAVTESLGGGCIKHQDSTTESEGEREDA
jgi:hypothetical protein